MPGVDVSGNIGACTAVTGAPHGTRAPCAGQDDAGSACEGSCNGASTSACTYPGRHGLRRELLRLHVHVGVLQRRRRLRQLRELPLPGALRLPERGRVQHELPDEHRLRDGRGLRGRHVHGAGLGVRGQHVREHGRTEDAGSSRAARTSASRTPARARPRAPPRATARPARRAAGASAARPGAPSRAARATWSAREARAAARGGWRSPLGCLVRRRRKRR